MHTRSGFQSRLTAQAMRLVLVLSMVLIQGCAAPGDDGIGGTGVAPHDDGIGGTGLSAALDPDGIGGTGIVGEITAIGSIQVAGLTVAVPGGITVQRAGRSLLAGALAQGQVVAVLASNVGGRLTASEIQVIDALVGAVTHADGERITVLGQQLRLNAASTRLAAPLNSVSALRVGQRVRVSGLWRPSGTLLVTRVELVAQSEPDALFAPVSAVSSQRLSVGMLAIQADHLPVVKRGDYVLATGSARGLTLQASALSVPTKVPFRNRVARVIVDGFLGKVDRRRVSIGALSAAVAERTTLRARMLRAVREQRRVIAGAVVRDGAAEIQLLRPLAPQRLLRGALPVPRVDADRPRPSVPILPERPQLPARAPALQRPQPVPRPPPLQRPQRPIDTRPADIRRSVGPANVLR